MHFLLLFLILIPTTAYAYLGPGVGTGIIAATLGIIVAIIAALISIVWFPFKRYLKKKKEQNKENKKSDYLFSNIFIYNFFL